MLEHKERIIKPPEMGIPVPRFHTLGLYVHNDVVVGLRLPEKTDPGGAGLRSGSFKPQWQLLLRMDVFCRMRQHCLHGLA